MRSSDNDPENQSRQKKSLQDDSYPQGIRNFEFRYRVRPESLESKAFDLVADDAWLEIGDFPINLRVLGSQEKIERIFSLMELNGRELASGLAAVAVQASWDPVLEVRYEAIKALGRFGKQFADSGLEDLSFAAETLRQVYQSPLSRIPVSEAPSMEVPFVIELKEGTPFYQMNEEIIRARALEALDSFSEEFRPTSKILLSFFKASRNFEASQIILNILHARFSDALQKGSGEPLLTSILDATQRLETGKAVSLLQIFHQIGPEALKNFMKDELFSRFLRRSRRAFDLSLQLYANDSLMQQQVLVDVFLRHPSVAMRILAASRGLNEFALMQGLCDNNSRVREACQQQLMKKHLSPSAITKLAALLGDKYGLETRRSAARILSEITDTSPATNQLLKAVQDPEPKVASLAAIALANSMEINEPLKLTQRALKEQSIRDKSPYVTFLEHLEVGLLSSRSDIFDALKDVIASRQEHIMLRERCIGILVQHAGWYGFELLRELRNSVEPTLQRHIDRNLRGGD